MGEKEDHRVIVADDIFVTFAQNEDSVCMPENYTGLAALFAFLFGMLVTFGYALGLAAVFAFELLDELVDTYIYSQYRTGSHVVLG